MIFSQSNSTTTEAGIEPATSSKYASPCLQVMTFFQKYQNIFQTLNPCRGLLIVFLTFSYIQMSLIKKIIEEHSPFCIIHVAKNLLKTALVGNQFYLSGAVQILLGVEDEGNPIIEFSVLSISVQPAGNVK